MRILSRFRKKDEDILPEDVEKYYKSQKRVRVGTAWLLGFLTLAITLVVALGLFYGVRYVYNQITGSDNTAEITPSGANQTGSPAAEPKKKTAKNQKNSRQNQNRQASGTSPRTGDTLPANGDTALPATGDPGL